MKREPKSRVLFLTVCSLNKERGGQEGYSESESLPFALPSSIAKRLLERRAEVRQLVMKRSAELTWGGKPLPDLAFNSNLKKGPDFGGRHTSAFMPAIHRYQGRFFQALGEEGRKKLCQPQRHTLFLSGLYGLLCPMEPIQLYSCPLLGEVSDMWRKDSLLTELLCTYIDRNGVEKVFDMTALDAYRKLVDWQRIGGEGVKVLHCFHAMAPGVVR